MSSIVEKKIYLRMNQNIENTFRIYKKKNEINMVLAL